MRSITIERSQGSPCALAPLDALCCCDASIASNRARRGPRPVMEQRRAEVVEGKDQTARPGSIRECIGCRGRTAHMFTALHLGWQDICTGCMGNPLGRLGLAVLARPPPSLLPCGLFESVARLNFPAAYINEMVFSFQVLLILKGLCCQGRSLRLRLSLSLYSFATMTLNQIVRSVTMSICWGPKGLATMVGYGGGAGFMSGGKQGITDIHRSIVGEKFIHRSKYRVQQKQVLIYLFCNPILRAKS